MKNTLLINSPAGTSSSSGGGTAAYTVTLAWPPSLNHAVVHTRTGQHYRTPQAKAFRALAVVTARNARTRCHWATLTVPAAVRIDLYPPTRRSYDADGKVKEVLDVLELAEVVANDKLVRDLRVVAHEELDPAGRCEVTVTTLMKPGQQATMN